MLEKALFITKLFLDGWEKSLSEDVLVPFFIQGCVLKIVSEPTRLAEKQPHTWSQDALHCWHDTGLMVALTLSSPDKLFPDAPNNRKEDSSEKMTLPQSSAVQSLYLLQNIRLSLMFFLETSVFFAALLDTSPST